MELGPVVRQAQRREANSLHESALQVNHPRKRVSPTRLNCFCHSSGVKALTSDAGPPAHPYPPLPREGEEEGPAGLDSVPSSGL
jgi:hypothetical protein